MKFNFHQSEFVETNTAPDQIAVVGQDRQLTWRDLEQEVTRLSQALRQHHSGTGPVLLYGHKEAGMVSAILACLQARIPYVPVDNIVPPARVEAICKIAQVDLVLCASELSVDHHPCLKIPELSYQGLPLGVAWKGAPDLAYIIFTSGSSGEPKGVQIQRGNVSDLATWLNSADFSFSASDILLNQCSFSFDVSFFDVIAALQAGATLVLNSPQEVKEVLPFAGRIQGATVWSSTPSFLSLALTLPSFQAQNFPNLRRFYVAGEVVHASLLARLHKRFPQGELWNAYGPTEATVITTLVHVTREIAEKYPSIPIGRVKPGVRMPTTATDGVSEGELWIVGPNVSPGYLNRPDLNETRFALHNGQRGYLTGDVGYQTDGLIFYKGRIDSQIKLHGYRIELDEIDNQVVQVPGVEEAATIGLRRDGDVKKLVCFVKCKAELNATIVSSIKEHLQKNLPYYMVPADFQVRQELPYNANHKVDRSALAQLL